MRQVENSFNFLCLLVGFSQIRKVYFVLVVGIVINIAQKDRKNNTIDIPETVNENAEIRWRWWRRQLKTIRIVLNFEYGFEGWR